MSAHVLMNLLNELGKRDRNVRLAELFISFSQRVISSIKQEHEC